MAKQTTTTTRRTRKTVAPELMTLDVKKHLGRNVDTALGERVLKMINKAKKKGVSGRNMTGTERDMATRLTAHGRVRRASVDGVWTYYALGN